VEDSRRQQHWCVSISIQYNSKAQPINSVNSNQIPPRLAHSLDAVHWVTVRVNGETFEEKLGAKDNADDVRSFGAAW
jgi:hypothetical protein